MEMVHLGIRVSRETHQELVRKSRDQDMSVSAVVRSILREHLRSAKKNGKARR